jgi:hypothetical protein
MQITVTFISGYDFGSEDSPIKETKMFESQVDYIKWANDMAYWGDEDKILSVHYNCR